MVLFDDFCQKIRLFFKGLEWEYLNLIKWEIVSLANTIAANPTLSTTKYLRKKCTKINKFQRSVNSVCHWLIHLHENIIQACQGHPTPTAGLTNLSIQISDIVNSLYSLIINYKAMHKSSFIENYVHL